MQWSIDIQTLPLKRPFRIARGSSTFRRTVRLTLVRDGITGWGEGAPNPRYGETPENTAAVLDSALPRLAGSDPGDREGFLEEAARTLDQNWSALQALDLAIHDWWGKSRGTPLFRVLGADPAAMPLTSWTVGIDDPESVAEQAREATAFRILKLKLGSSQDRAMVEALRRVDDRVLRVDANEGWADREHALKEIEWLAERGVEFVEQPLPADRWDDLVWLKRHSPLPLYADESMHGIPDLEQIAQAYHGINIKLAKCGGIRNALDLMGRAAKLGLQVMLGCMVESSCGIAGAAQIAPLADHVDLDSNLYLSEDPFEGHPVVDGRIHLNDRPGLGVVARF